MCLSCSRITFNDETKIGPEKMLKALDEYFYLGLGRKFHLFVLPSDQEDQRRSWVNIAIKVVSYCTLILPLIGFVAGTVLSAYLHWQGPAPIPQEKIKILKKEPSIEDLQSDLVQWLTSPISGNIDSVAAIMDPLLELMTTEPESVEENIQRHTQIADLLAKADPSIRSEQMRSFYQYLARKYGDFRPWIAFRIFLQYYRKCHRSNDDLCFRTLADYLVKRSKEIGFKSYGDVLEANIDPREWFGWNRSNYSLWKNPSDGSFTTLPLPIKEAICLRVGAVQQRYRGKKTLAVIDCRLGASFPPGFVDSLTKQLQNMGILLG